MSTASRRRFQKSTDRDKSKEDWRRLLDLGYTPIMALSAPISVPDQSLRKLQSGELTLDEYLDERVEVALSHVKGRIPEERLEMLREIVREHVRTDPVMVEMVRRVTGVTLTGSVETVEH